MRGIGLSVLPQFYEYGLKAEDFPKEPLLVTVCTLTPVSVKDPIALDSLIAKGLYYELFHGKPLPNVSIPYWIPLPLEVEKEVENLPLWKSTDFFPIDSKVFSANVHRRNGDNPYWVPAMMATVNDKKVRRQPSAVRGQYMDSRNPDRRIVANQWQASCVGNSVEIKRLLSYLYGLGGKGGRGAGRVIDWHVEPLEREFGLINDEGKTLKALPMLAGEFAPGWAASLQGWTPPYWRKDTWRMCTNSYARKFIC